MVSHQETQEHFIRRINFYDNISQGNNPRLFLAQINMQKTMNYPYQMSSHRIFPLGLEELEIDRDKQRYQTLSV